MDSFGEFLKRERELRGVTIEEIAKNTNISSRFLKALENDSYDNLPAEVFVKGFLRSYAENTGMEPNEVILAYDEFMAHKRNELNDPEAGKLPTTAISRFSKKSYIFLAFPVILVFFLIYYFVGTSGDIKSSIVNEIENIQESKEEPNSDLGRKGKTLLKAEPVKNKIIMKTKDETAETPEPKEPKKKLISEDIMSALSMEKEIKMEEKTVERRETNVENVLELSLEAIEDVWVKILVDDNDAKEYLLSAGEKIKWAANNKFVITLGNALGANLKLNNKEVFFQAPPSNILRDYLITLDNIKSQ